MEALPKIELHQFQRHLIDRVTDAAKSGRKRILVVLPTGGGKTVIAAEIARRAAVKGSRILFVVHRQELVKQASITMDLAGLTATEIAAGKRTPLGVSDTQIATVQTLVRRIAKMNEAQRVPDKVPHIVFWDEAHHCAANTWRKCSEQLRKWKPNLVEIGLTATPERTDGKGLGDMFEAPMVEGPGVAELIEDGFLSPFVVVGPLTKLSDIRARLKKRAGDFDVKQQGEEVQSIGTIICGETVGLYQKHLDGKQAVFFGVDIAHSKNTCAAFNRAGIPAAHIDGLQSSYLSRVIAVEDFRAGRIKVLCNCNIVGEGFDCPNAAGVIIARHTQSVTYFLQAAGRALRYQPDKVAKIIDQAGNFSHLGHPDEPRIWSLDDRSKRRPDDERAKHVAYTRACKKCGVLFSRRNANCPQCGHPAVLPTEITSVLDADIGEVHSSQAPKQKRPEPKLPRGILMSRIRDCNGDIERLRALEEEMGYKRGFAEKQAELHHKRFGGMV